MTTLPSAPELSARARDRFLHQHREAPASFYLQHSPSLRRLNHLFDKTGSDNQSQAAAIPQLAGICRKRSHVAKGFLGP